MNKQTSIYLDLLRFLAAMAVFIGHFPNKGFAGPEIPIIDFGISAVMLFFVLSGYVIAFISERDKTFRIFAVNRIARLWSVVIPAILLTCFLYFVGSRINYTVYKDVVANDNLLLRILCNLFFLQGIQNYSMTLLNNGPFWSLANEFWYYCMFAIFTFIKNAFLRYFLIALVLICVGGKIALLFPIWFLGFVIYKSKKHIKLNGLFACILYISSILIFYLKCFSKLFSGIEEPLIHQYIYGLIFSIHIFSVQYINISMIGYFEKPIRFLSSFTFSLYLFHMPLLYFVSSLIVYNRNNIIHITFIVIIVLFCVFILSLVTERKKNNLRELMNNTINTFISLAIRFKTNSQRM